MRAASARSNGMVRKYWRSRNVPNAPPQKAGSHSGTCVPIRPSHLNIIKFGTSVICGGSISVASRHTNSPRRNGKSTTAKQNAAIAQVSIWPIVLSVAIDRLLMISRVKGS